MCIDPVARFHLRNGASIHNLNWMGNPTTIGLASSAGIMVNYLYDLNDIEQNKSKFLLGDVVYGEHIRRICPLTTHHQVPRELH